MLRFRQLVLATALVAFGGACDAPADRPADDDDAVAEAAEGVELVPINRSDVRGLVRIEPSGDEVVAELSLDGIDPDQRYYANLHQGSCAAGGALVLTLGRIRAGSEGTGSTRVLLDPGQVPDGQDLFVQVYDQQDGAVACADVVSVPTDPSLMQQGRDTAGPS